MAEGRNLALLLELLERAFAVLTRAVNGQMVTDEQLAQAKAEYREASKIFNALKAPPKAAADGTVPEAERPLTPAELQDGPNEDEPIASDLEPRPALNGVPLETLPDLSAKPANPALHASHKPHPGPYRRPDANYRAEDVAAGGLDDLPPTPIAEVVFETPDPIDEPTPEDERANDEGETPQEDE